MVRLGTELQDVVDVDLVDADTAETEKTRSEETPDELETLRRSQESLRSTLSFADDDAAPSSESSSR